MTAPLRIAVIGPGAIGGTIAAWLAQDAAHEVIACVRTPFDGIEIDTPEGPISAEVKVLTDPEQATPVDWAIVATKTYDNVSAALWLHYLVGDRTRLAVLQNGVEHSSFWTRERIGADRLVPVVVDIPAERLAPGRVHQRRAGTMLVPHDAAGRAFAALFKGTPIAVVTVTDFTTALWRKLAINCAGIVNAITLRPAGIAHQQDAAEAMRMLVQECIAVGRAEGADLPDSLAEEVVQGYRDSDPDSVNSILADRLAGRPMETDARNGVIVRMGRTHGIETPANRMALALLGALTAL